LQPFIPIVTISFSMAKACLSVVLRVEKQVWIGAEDDWNESNSWIYNTVPSFAEKSSVDQHL
jgi:hypothetical protein